MEPATAAIGPDDATQVVRNLLDNADRHAASVVTVVLRRADDRIEISVENAGHPIPAEDRERIFDPFTRLDEARASDDGGSGLGLAIVCMILRAVGGTIHVDDAAHVTRFVVRLHGPLYNSPH
ncbi:MAG: ATP-binding protein [Ilumatobacteraceae bacterium]